MYMVKYLLALFILSTFSLHSQTSDKKNYTSNVTLIGLQDGIMIHTRKRPIIVRDLHSDSKGFYYTTKDCILLPKAWWPFSSHKKKRHKHYCYCIVCKPTTMFVEQSSFVSHMRKKQHIGSVN